MKRKTVDEFINESKKIHGDKYDYSKVNYVNCQTKVCIICPEHGEFWQTPSEHLSGYGCKFCGGTNKLSKEDFIKKAKEIHGDKYDYSKIEYINNKTKICIICPEHGEFWQTPYAHLRGDGCKKCNVSLIENELINFFNEKGVPYTFRNRSFHWLEGLELDFYLPDYNTAIECQGIQHFKENHFFEPLNVIQERDYRKLKLCNDNGIKLLYYSNLHINYPYLVYENKEKLLNDILND